VTRSGRGIGKAIAVKFGREGSKIVVTSLAKDEVDETVAQLGSFGVDTLGVVGDLSKSNDVENLFERVDDRYGRIDVLVNNAADLRQIPFSEFDRDLFDYLFSTNVSGAFHCSSLAAERMERSGTGSIVHISSVSGRGAHWPGLPYDATKGALDAMTRGMGVELADRGIRVNAVAPGATFNQRVGPPPDSYGSEAKERIPIRRIAGGLEIAAVVAFLASHEASYIIGQVIYVDGGLVAQLSPRTAPV